VDADHRSAHPAIPGLPWWGAVLLAATFTAIGFAYDAGSGEKQLSFVFSATYFIGCVLAVLAVRQNGIFTTVIQPPLLLFVAVPTAYFLFTHGEGDGIKDLLINCAYPLIERFPLMFFASAAALLAGLVRWYQGRAARKTTPKDDAKKATATSPGVGSTMAAKFSSLLSRSTADDDDEPEIEAPVRRRRSTDSGRRKATKRTTPPRSRHSRPPETEIIAPVSDRPRRPRPSSSRQAEPPPAEPRRRPRSTSTTRRSAPPPSERRSSAYERQERRRRADDYQPRESLSSNGNGTHHPVSNVRYRRERDGDDAPEYRTRRRTPRPPRDADGWEYDI
jgi:hypothetical protein